MADYSHGAKPSFEISSSEDLIPIAHVLKPGEIDNFIISVGGDHPYAGRTIRLVLTYNGTLEVTSRKLSLALLLDTWAVDRGVGGHHGSR